MLDNTDHALYQQKIEVICDGFISPFGLTGIPGKISGCVYRADGSKVDLSERMGGHAGDKITTDNPETLGRPNRFDTLKGRGLYLGHFMAGHFGHFFFENLSTFWIFEDQKADEFDYFVFHPFAFGTSSSDFAEYAFKAFGIDRERIVLVGSTALVFEELVVPERLARINHSSDPRLRWVYTTVSGPAMRAAPSRRLYVSRREFNKRQQRRVVANEMEVEALFVQAGFDVIYPETMTFPQQIDVCGDAAMVAGMSGSNLFNVLFAPPGALLIELGDPRYAGKPNPCQPPCNAVSGAHGRFIPFKGAEFGRRRTMIFDMRYLIASLEAIIREDFPVEDKDLRLRRPAKSPRDCLELGYRTVRPVLGQIANDLRTRVRGKRRSATKLYDG